MGLVVYLDTILVPLSLFLTVGYHTCLWHSFKNKHFHTTIGINTLKRRSCFFELHGGEDEKAMLAVQSLRNTLMGTTLTATVSLLVILSLAALVNNAFNATRLFNNNAFFGSQTAKILALKFGSAALVLSISFLCGSMAIGFLIHANFLINARGEFSPCPEYTQIMFEKGFILALISNRMLCITFPLLLWMLGPVPVWLSSFAVVWGLYQLNFAGKLAKCDKQSL